MITMVLNSTSSVVADSRTLVAPEAVAQVYPTRMVFNTQQLYGLYQSISDAI
jgi:hypothetical protein